MEMGIWVGIKQGQNYNACWWVVTPPFFFFSYTKAVQRKLSIQKTFCN